MINLRVKFTKHGAIRYIGHLDVMRYFQKCIRRAGLDIAYTGGFSPHQVMSFAQPLGVGLVSEGEYMDIGMNSVSACEEIRDALNAASVPEIRIVNVSVLPEDTPNAMASIFAADYRVRFRMGRSFSRLLTQEILDAYMAQETILYEKETKKGSRVVDLKEGIYALSLADVPSEDPELLLDGVSCEPGGIYMRLNASSGNNIKPVQVMESLAGFLGEVLAENAIFVTRLELYTNLEKDGAKEPKLVALDRVGKM